MEIVMKNRKLADEHTQRPPIRAQVAPAFRSAKSAARFAADLAEVRNAITHHGEQATRARQAAEEQVQHVRSREELIAEKQREIEEFRIQREQEIGSIRAEIERYDAAAKAYHQQAEQHVTAQQEAELEKSDIEDVLSNYAPGALDQFSATPPAGTPANGTQAVVTGGYPTPPTGTGPQQAPPQGR